VFKIVMISGGVGTMPVLPHDKPNSPLSDEEGLADDQRLPQQSRDKGFSGIVRQLLKDVLETVAPAVIIALLLTHFVAQRTVVYGQSMEPNLHPNQQLMVEKVSCRVAGPARGEVVVVDVPFSEIPLIKRVIGLPGETVEIRDSKVYIDGEVLDEPYLPGIFQYDFGPIIVPPDHVFVMGDNRTASNDSRVFGPVPVKKVLGRAWLSIWPLDALGFVK
jgi:signal peptidase I